jgi:hypothetical protein
LVKKKVNLLGEKRSTSTAPISISFMLAKDALLPSQTTKEKMMFFPTKSAQLNALKKK